MGEEFQDELYGDEFDDELLGEGEPITLRVPRGGERSFSLVASVPDDTDWEDVEGIMYELGEEFTGESRELDDKLHGRVLIQPAEEGRFAVRHRHDSYELYLSALDEDDEE